MAKASGMRRIDLLVGQTSTCPGGAARSAALAPSLAAGRSPIVAAHGNTLRALVKYLDGISDAAIPELEIPTGVPLVYELDDNLHPLARYYLGNSPATEEAQKHLDHVIRTAGQVA